MPAIYSFCILKQGFFAGRARLWLFDAFNCSRPDLGGSQCFYTTVRGLGKGVTITFGIKRTASRVNARLGRLYLFACGPFVACVSEERIRAFCSLLMALIFILVSGVICVLGAVPTLRRVGRMAMRNWPLPGSYGWSGDFRCLRLFHTAPACHCGPRLVWTYGAGRSY